MTRAPGGARRPQVHRGVELHCGERCEDEARSAGHVAVAGLDEVGRGAPCGSIVAPFVILGPGSDTQSLDDSKRFTRRRRGRPAERLQGTERWLFT